MSVRQSRKKTVEVIKPTVYLVYFKDDKTVSISDARDIVEDCSELEVGSLCHVKVRTKIFQATVITYGSIEEVRNVEEQFVNKIYNPEFIVEDDDVTDMSGITKDENDVALMNKANGTGLENNAVVMKTACTAVKRKFIDKQKGKQSKKSKSAKPKESVKKIKKKELKEQKSSVTVVAVSSNPQSDSSGLQVTSSLMTKSSTASFGLPSVSSAASSDLPVTCVSKSADAITTSRPPTVSDLPVSSPSSSSGFESPPPLPPPISTIDPETVHSLVVRVDKLEKQSSFLNSRCNYIMSHFFGPMNHVNHSQDFGHVPHFSDSPLVSSTPQRVAHSLTSPQQLFTSQGSYSEDVFQPPSLFRPANNSVDAPFIPPSTNPPPIAQSSALGENSSQQPSTTNPTIQPTCEPTVKNTEVSKNMFIDPDEVIQKYPKLQGGSISLAGRLAVRLAVESYFGDDLLKQSTVYGVKDCKALPEGKVQALKKKLLVHYKMTAHEFEPMWSKCVGAINHWANALRRKGPMSLIDLTNSN